MRPSQNRSKIVFFSVSVENVVLRTSPTRNPCFQWSKALEKLKKIRSKIGPANRHPPMRRFFRFLGPQGSQSDRKAFPKGAQMAPKGTPRWSQNRLRKRLGTPGSPNDPQAQQNDIKMTPTCFKMTLKRHQNLTKIAPNIV